MSAPSLATRKGAAAWRVPTQVLVAAAAGLLALLLIGPLWDAGGMPNTADGILHIHRASEMTRAWAEGVLWPRWYAGGYEGLGLPLFHYYSPLFYQLVAPLHLLLIPLDLAAKIVLTVFFLLSAAALYSWLSRLFSPAAALAGAALYLSGPNFFREYYFQGDYPQTIALFWLPVVLWAIARLYDEGRAGNWIAAAGSIALLAVAHNITAMLGAVFLALYWLTLPLWRRSWIGWLRTAAAALLGLGLSAFFWLPALADLRYVRVDTLRGAFFHFSRYFIYPSDLLAAPPPLDVRATNPTFPYLLGWPAWAALAAGLVVLVVAAVSRGRLRRHALGAGLALVIAAACLALTQSWSTPIWDHLPGLSLLQFPGRLLGPAALAAALAGAAAVHAIRPSRWRTAAMATVLLGAGLCSAAFLFPRLPFLSLTGFSPADTQAFERTTGDWGLTSTNGYLPRWAAGPDEDSQYRAPTVELPSWVQWQWNTPDRASVQSATTEPLPVGALVLPLHYFPAWEVRAGDVVLPSEPDDRGLTRVDVPPGTTRLDVVWHGTAWERRARWASLVSLLLILGGAALLLSRVRISSIRRHPEERELVAAPRPVSSGQERQAVLLAVGVLFVLAAGRYAIRVLDLGWFQTASSPGAVAVTAHPVQLKLTNESGSQVSLIGWDILPDSDARPGGALRVRLYWQADATTTENLASFVHLVTATPEKSWAVVQNEDPGRVPTSRWTTALYVVDDLILQLPLDLPPASYTLSAGLVDHQGHRLVVAGSGASISPLTEVKVAPVAAGRNQPLRPSVAAAAQFGDRLKLQGYDLQQEGERLTLTLYWQVLKKDAAAADPTVFVHLVDDHGTMVAQSDGPMAEGLPLLQSTGDGSLIIDKHEMTLEAAAAGRGQSLLVGLYDRASMTRLPVTPESGAAGHYTADNALVIEFR